LWQEVHSSIIQQLELTMFYKAFALLFLAGTVTAELANGLYRIASTKFEGAVIKSFTVGGTVSLVYGGQVFDEHQYVSFPLLAEFTGLWIVDLARVFGASSG
jgi:hypothetical protein